MPEELMDRLLPEGIGPAVHVEREALAETRIALQERISSSAIALTASALVFACVPREYNPLIEVLRRSGVWGAGVLSVIALVFWWRFLRAAARLRGSGLQRPRGMGPRMAWQAAGCFTSSAIVITICAAFGVKTNFVAGTMLPGWALALWLGERLGQIPGARKALEEDKIKLFPDDEE
jgi:hypothetical protein